MCVCVCVCVKHLGVANIKNNLWLYSSDAVGDSVYVKCVYVICVYVDSVYVICVYVGSVYVILCILVVCMWFETDYLCFSTSIFM